jgi:Dirigent-like protein
VTRGTLGLLIVAVAFAVAGCGGGGGKTLHVFTKPAKATTVDLGPAGKSAGDIYVFDTAILDENKAKVIGHVFGTQTSLDLDPASQVVQAMITYTFNGGDSITIGGISRYPKTGVGLITNKTYERPILGGTGKYADARGTVTSVLHPGGMYEQTFHLEG